MAELGSCEGPISSEHLISRSVIDVLAPESVFNISGLPWLKPGETRSIGPNSLTANCLCKGHNTALSALDGVAGRFFEAVKTALIRKDGTSTFVVSGHDVERWLLKTAKAMAASQNLSHDRKRLSGAFPENVDVIRLLDDPFHWAPGIGLHCAMNTGESGVSEPDFQLAPLSDGNELYGFAVEIMGLRFILAVQHPSFGEVPWLRSGQYRPSQISVKHPDGRDVIHLSWEDGLRHDPIVVSTHSSTSSPR